jgi:hypothetical protein
MVWIVEGGLNTPTNYAIADCFAVRATDIPLFPYGYSKFKLKVLGDKSLLTAPVALDSSELWFSELRDRFITKRRFFCSLDAHPNIQGGFIAASRLAI